MDEDARVPAPDAPVEERLLFLQENMVSFANQFSMPVIEVALVLSKYIRILLESLQNAAQSNGEALPSRLTEPWHIDTQNEPPRIDSSHCRMPRRATARPCHRGSPSRGTSTPRTSLLGSTHSHLRRCLAASTRTGWTFWTL